jgi:phage terminase Nu1 subunit (DNA packaging protein)
VIAELVQNEISVAELASSFGRSEQSINGYKRRGMPCHSFEAAAAWIDENIAGNGPPTIGERSNGGRRTPRGLDETEQRARIRKLNAEAAGRELKNAEAEGRLVDADDVVRQVACMFSVMRGRMEDLPDEVIKEIPDAMRGTVGEAVARNVYLALKEMSSTRIEPLGINGATAILRVAEQLKREQSNGQTETHEQGRGAGEVGGNGSGD